MPCYKPLTAYQHKTAKTDKNKSVVVFQSPVHLEAYDRIKIACGRCIGCRLERSRLWAARCMHESALHDDNYFLTLTYNDENLPQSNSGPTLVPRDLQLFIKRLRKLQKFRFYACGEYGDNLQRPHYHAIVFGLRLTDLHYHCTSGGFRLFTSEMLSRVWKKGYVLVGNVTFESAAYVARYIVKKQLGKGHGCGVISYDPSTGEVLDERVPEFTRMSRNPGIGSDFYSKYKYDFYGAANGSVVLRGGIKFGTPRYYDNKFELENLDKITEIRKQRRLKAEANVSETSSSRLKARLAVKMAQNKQLKRTIE